MPPELINNANKKRKNMTACKTRPDRLLLRPTEAAEAMGISLRTLMNWERDGKIPSVRPKGSRCLRFSLAAIESWIREQSTAMTLQQSQPASGSEGEGVRRIHNNKDGPTKSPTKEAVTSVGQKAIDDVL